MINRLLTVVSVLAFAICLGTTVFGQATTGSIEGTVKDPKGAVIPGASVTARGESVGFNKTVQTNKEGFYQFVQVPAGTYKITVAPISGFATAMVDGFVAIEKTTTTDINLGIGGSVNVVQVEGDPLGVAIDTSDSKVQTTITRALIDKLPTGASFTSLLKISPGTRPEPLSGGFQVDGASGSENTFIIDGQPMENFRTGTLNGQNNIPTSLVSEIQIKTGGFEAEHGGASGGVIVVATKSGSDTFHGEVGTSFEDSKLQPGPRFALQRFVSSSSSQAAIDANPQYLFAIRQPRDAYLNTYPNATLGGPLVKSHVWFFGIFAPQIFGTSRTSNFYNAVANSNFSTGSLVLTPRVATASQASVPLGSVLDPIRYNTKVRQNYAYGRVDMAFFDKLRGTISYLWNPSQTRGLVRNIAVSQANPVDVKYNGIFYTDGEYSKLQGGRTNADTLNFSGTYTPTSKMVINGRYGHTFLNEKGNPYAIANVVRYVCGGSTGSYSTIATGCPGGNGFQNVTTNSITTFDISIKNEYNLDASYYVADWAGKHEFKGGYTNGRTENRVQAGFSGTGIVTLFYGQDYAQANTGVSLPCALGTASCLGVGTLNRTGAKGVAKNRYQAVFFQDKWQPSARLTLNLGLRDENEDLPAYNVGFTIGGSKIPPIHQGWKRKLAPRLGGAYDLTGDGKTKIYASYGWFYDRMRFELPRGLFGGNFFRVDYFPITAAHPNYDYYTPSVVLGTFTDPPGGGNPSTTGGISQLQRDFRVPSNLTAAQQTALGLPVTGIDPNLKSWRQNEMTFGMERELSRTYVLGVRYTRKNVAKAIEDHAILGLNESENYPIGNPGEGLDLKLDLAAGTVKSAIPQRVYNVVEVVFTKRLSNNYFYSANYTWSRLFGNYSGLASSDESGRTSPSVDRFFDYPINGFTATGQPDNGLLATDRTHTFKSYGGYTWNWWGSKTNSTDFSFFETILQGTPQTTFISVVATSIPLSKRGDLGRTPVFWQTDLGMSHRYKFGRDNRLSLVADINVTNALNNNTVIGLGTSRYRVTNAIAATDIDPTYNASTQTLIPILNKIILGQIGTQLSQLENGGLPSLAGRSNPKNALYGKPQSYQAARNVRFGFRLIF